MSIKSLYLIGSLRNEKIVEIANAIEEATGMEVYSSWFCGGPEADDYWKKHEQARGRSFKEALQHYAAKHIFEIDKHHIDRCDAAVLVCPAGKSGHLELGYVAGCGKPAYVLLDPTVDRWDVMYQFCTDVFEDKDELIRMLSNDN